MPLMVMEGRANPVRVATLVGHTYLFNPGIPVMVQPNAVKRCMQAGARMVASDDNTLLEEPVQASLTIEQQNAAVMELLRDMLLNHEQYREEFNSNNQPKATFINERLTTTHRTKFNFASPEIVRMWRAVRDEQAVKEGQKKAMENG